MHTVSGMCLTSSLPDPAGLRHEKQLLGCGRTRAPQKDRLQEGEGRVINTGWELVPGQSDPGRTPLGRQGISRSPGRFQGLMTNMTQQGDGSCVGTGAPRSLALKGPPAYGRRCRAQPGN